jgi:hypothetical protein
LLGILGRCKNIHPRTHDQRGNANTQAGRQSHIQAAGNHAGGHTVTQSDIARLQGGKHAARTA